MQVKDLFCFGFGSEVEGEFVSKTTHVYTKQSFTYLSAYWFTYSLNRDRYDLLNFWFVLFYSFSVLHVLQLVTESYKSVCRFQEKRIL